MGNARRRDSTADRISVLELEKRRCLKVKFLDQQPWAGTVN